MFRVRVELELLYYFLDDVYLILWHSFFLIVEFSVCRSVLWLYFLFLLLVDVAEICLK